VILAGNTGLVGAGLPSVGEMVLDLSQLVNICSLDLADGRSVMLSDQRGNDPEARLQAWDQELADARDRLGLSKGAFDGAMVTVEAGVTVDGLNALLRPLGIEYPMDMGSNAAATIGGCTANGSAGARALRNGTGADMAAKAFGFWATGEPAVCANPTPGVPRRLAGRPLVDSSRFPLGENLIGSQGTLGVITKVQVLTSKSAVAAEVALFPMPTLREGVALVDRARSHFQTGSTSLELAELIDRKSLLLVAEKEGITIPFENPESASEPYFIMLQARADTQASADELTEALLTFVERESENGTEVFYDPASGDRNLIRRLRHSITHASDARLGEMKSKERLKRKLPSDSKAILTSRIGFDVAVPLAAIDRFADRWVARVDEEFPELEMNLFGHLGVGGFHIHHRGPMPPETRRRLFDAMAETVIAHDGTISAEHGVGPLWTPLFLAHAPKSLKTEIAEQFSRRDPARILAPRAFGKRI
jgi:FAD/FMN-containing dehydrogenase